MEIEFSGLDLKVWKVGILGFLLFASNLARERYAMWILVLPVLPLDCRWIMFRDFNMVEIPLERPCPNVANSWD